MVNRMSECDARVVAMAIDTDGCIGLQKHYGHHSPSISFSVTSRELVEKVRDLVDGTKAIYEISFKKYGYSNMRNQHRVLWTSLTDVIAILEQVEPHLIVKKTQAGLILKYCFLKLKRRRSPPGEEEKHLVEDIYELNEGKGRTRRQTGNAQER